MFIYILITKFFFMKRLEKIRMSSSLLNKRELKELKGGDDVYNRNIVDCCECIYNNKPSAIYNRNSVDSCSCHCSY